ncbi:protein draper-like [Physella acuta]|uniref:protein draper-like n=1 Tax=Physella acuta TaxID=109671 RepID=UPI0027DBD9F5|nr:protein draper-like [Physella acuta]
MGSSCVHTKESDSNPALTLTLSRPYLLTRYEVYNRYDDKCCPERLKGFTLKSYNDQTLVYNYTDVASEALRQYTIVPNRGGNPVTRVNIAANYIEPSTRKKILSLCELEMYGDSICPAGRYGIDCSSTCMCQNKSEPCHVATGLCPSVCSAGYWGQGCHYECPVGRWGIGCLQTCSESCEGGQCEKTSGVCTHGCVGYTSPNCSQVCKPGWYGSNCSLSCDVNCLDPCHHITGNCTLDVPVSVDNVPVGVDNITHGQNCSNLNGSSCVEDADRGNGSHVEGCGDGRTGEDCVTGLPTVDTKSTSSIGVVIGIAVAVVIVVTVVGVGIAVYCRRIRASPKIDHENLHKSENSGTLSLIERLYRGMLARDMLWSESATSITSSKEKVKKPDTGLTSLDQISEEKTVTDSQPKGKLGQEKPEIEEKQATQLPPEVDTMYSNNKIVKKSSSVDMDDLYNCPVENDNKVNEMRDQYAHPTSNLPVDKHKETTKESHPYVHPTSNLPFLKKKKTPKESDHYVHPTSNLSVDKHKETPKESDHYVHPTSNLPVLKNKKTPKQGAKCIQPTSKKTKVTEQSQRPSDHYVQPKSNFPINLVQRKELNDQSAPPPPAHHRPVGTINPVFVYDNSVFSKCGEIDVYENDGLSKCDKTGGIENKGLSNCDKTGGMENKGFSKCDKTGGIENKGLSNCDKTGGMENKGLSNCDKTGDIENKGLSKSDKTGGIENKGFSKCDEIDVYENGGLSKSDEIDVYEN